MFLVRDIRQGENISQFYRGNVYLAAQLFRQTVRTQGLGRAILAKTVSSEYSLFTSHGLHGGHSSLYLVSRPELEKLY